MASVDRRKRHDRPSDNLAGRANNGGKRPGAGRPAGSVTRKTRETAERIASDGGVTPLDVMALTMRHLWQAATKDGKIVDEAKALQACAIAEKCSPYLHPRISSVELSGDGGGPLKIIHEMA